jgi:hypothetical protein
VAEEEALIPPPNMAAALSRVCKVLKAALVLLMEITAVTIGSP